MYVAGLTYMKRDRSAPWDMGVLLHKNVRMYESARARFCLSQKLLRGFTKFGGGAYKNT